MKRFVCIHGHFYQPPRENPWIESIETQDSAAPFHDWNDRITDECYGPNAAARILDFHGDVSVIQNNYSKISFNFGPTLLSWLEVHRPATYRSILEADLLSQKRFSGHGSALAQVYNHIIMPLANRRDKQTQIEWGLKDFEHRFSRKAEGIWLAETAVDLETLELLVDAGVRFTLLAPRQASRIKKLSGGDWQNVSNSRIDPRRPYLCHLPSGRSITLFFYDGFVAQDVAFSGLLKNGEEFANRLLNSLDESPDLPQLAHIATDGESYGHHHRYGEMALAYALLHLEKQNNSALTIYGEFLDQNPSLYEVEIFENSSWSCVHGIERWRSDCGCCTGGNNHWNQKWRGPLRNGLDRLRDQLGTIYENHAKTIFHEPWETRNRAILVHLGKISASDFIQSEASRPLDPQEILIAIKLLEMQRQSLLMFTSCGWFFDEISGLEPVQILQYAARAIQLAEEMNESSLENDLLQELAHAPSNILSFKNGEIVYKTYVKPSLLDFYRVGAHIATLTILEKTPPPRWHIYSISTKVILAKTIGKTEFRFGRMILQSNSTHETFDFVFSLIHLGDHNLTIGIKEFAGTPDYEKLEKKWRELSEFGDALQIIRNIDADFSKEVYILTSLLRDTQSLVLNYALKETFKKIEETFESIYQENHTLLNILQKSSFVTPPLITATIDLLYNAQMQKALQTNPLNSRDINNIIDEFLHWNPKLDQAKTQYLIRKSLADLLAHWQLALEKSQFLSQSIELLLIVERLKLKIDFWEMQKWAYDFRFHHLSKVPAQSSALFTQLLKQLKVSATSSHL